MCVGRGAKWGCTSSVVRGKSSVKGCGGGVGLESLRCLRCCGLGDNQARDDLSLNWLRIDAVSRGLDASYKLIIHLGKA